MRIALLGTRGIPAAYSGFETCVEQLGKRLVARGHDVSVYCRSHHIQYQGSSYLGMRLIKHGTLRNKYLDTIVHSFISSLHALGQGYDIALYFIAGNSPVTWIPRLVGTKTVLNVDGLDWKREKWPKLAKKYLQFSEYLATILPTCFVTDNKVVQAYYQDKFKRTPPVIPYGSEVDHVPPGETLMRLGLEKDKYVLFVGRLVPDNCVHHLIKAFKSLETDLRCVVVGGSAYSNAYEDQLQETARGDPRIILPGYVFGKGYQELGSNAFLFVETSGVGGTHPALTEAMGFGNCVIVNNTPENLETIGDAGLSYDGSLGAESLREVLQECLDHHELIVEYKHRAREFAKKNYSWEAVTDQYERLFYKLAHKDMPNRLKSVG